MRETWVQSLGWEDPLEKEYIGRPIYIHIYTSYIYIGRHIYRGRHAYWSDLAAAATADMHMGFSGSWAGGESSCNAGDPGSMLGSGRSPEEGIG